MDFDDMSDKKPDIEKLREEMAAKIKAIPSVKLSEKQIEKLREKNREQDRDNLETTKQILKDRRTEAETDGDQKKKFHTIAIEASEKDLFSIRERIRELELQYKTMRSVFSDEDWQILSMFSDLNDPKYWEKARQNGYSDNDIALYYKDVFGIDPKKVVKFIGLLKVKLEMDSLQNKIK
jgi:hypothetical protein